MGMFWKTKSAASRVGDQQSSDLAHDVEKTGAPQPPENVDALPTSSSLLAQSRGSRGYVIPKSYRISGRILTDRPVLVEGELSGGVVQSPSVTVLPGGTLKAQTKAASLTVFGCVDAAVEATSLVEIMPRGQVSGRLQTPALRTEPGAVLTGATLVVGPRSSR